MESVRARPDDRQGERKCKWIITIHSQKGGVGKTLIALYLARRMAEKERDGLNSRTVLIDADLTGTSLAHAIDLRAPNPWNGKGPQPAPLTVAETHERLKALSQDPGETGRLRHSLSADAPLQLINDYLFCDPIIFRSVFEKTTDGIRHGLRAWDLLWWWDTSKKKHAEKDLVVDLDNLRMIPSSGFHSHVSQCLPHIYKEDITGYLDHRLTELVWQLWHAQWDGPFDVVIIDCPPTLSGISRVALNVHGSVGKRMDNSPKDRQEPIVHLALFMSSADVQDVVGLWHGLDSLLAEEGEPVYGPSEEKKQKKNKSVRLDEVRIVMNRVPDTLVPGDAFLTEEERVEQQDSVDPQGTPRGTYNLKERPDALRYFCRCSEAFLRIQSNSLKDPKILGKLLALENQTFVIPYNRECAEQFVLRRATYGMIEDIESLFRSMKEAKPREK